MTTLVRKDAPCECGDSPDSGIHVGDGSDWHPYLRCRHSEIRREERLLSVLPNGEELVEERFFCGTCGSEFEPS